MSGYFEPNNTIDDSMYGAEDMDDEDEEGEDDISESDEEEAPKLVPVKKQEKEAPKKPEPVKAAAKVEAKPAKDVQGFQKGSDLEKSLKIANKNTMKNTLP